MTEQTSSLPYIILIMLRIGRSFRVLCPGLII